MYKQYKVNTSHKVKLEDVFTGEKYTVEFLRGQIVEGRIDIIGSKIMITLPDGTGGIVNRDFFEQI